MLPTFTTSHHAAALRRGVGPLLVGLLLAAGAAHAQSLAVTRLSPARNAVAAPRPTPVAVTFNQPLANNAATLGALKVFSQQAGGLKKGAATVSSNTLTFQPTVAFRAGETVSATLQYSGSTVDPQVFQFTTATAPSAGTFGGGSDQALANGLGVTEGDVNGDGFPDLLYIDQINTATEIGHTVTVRLNDGRGTFGSPRAVEVGISPTSLALGDMDNDGDLDLVVGAGIQNTSALNVALNDGEGTFGSPQSYSIFGRAPQNFVLGDINSDGYLDVVASYGPYASTAAFVNNRKGGLSLLYYIPSASNGSLALGDVNGDGYLDLLSASTLDGPNVYVALNKSPRAAIFGESTKVSLGMAENGGTEAVAVGDVNGDGFLDFVAKHDAQISVRLNDGQGNFSGSQEVPATGYSKARNVALGDVNGDGFLDLLAIDAQKGTVSTHLNDGKGTFGKGSEVAVGANAELTLADLNGDNTLDIVALNFKSLSVRLNQPTPAAPLTVTGVSPARNAVAAPRPAPVAVTFNQALANNAATQGALKVFSPQAGGRKAGMATVSGNTLTFQPTAAFKAGETVSATLTAEAQSTTGAMAQPQVFQFTTATAPSTGTFGGGSDVAVGTDPRSVAVGDLDGDGDLDLVSANTTANMVSVRLNNGSAVFSGTQEVAVGESPRTVVLADVDADGDLDLLTANGSGQVNSSRLSVRLNNGRGVFGGGSDVVYGRGQTVTYFDLVVGDVDRDGDLDLIAPNVEGAGNFFGSNIDIYLNDGKGSFSFGTQSFKSGLIISSVALGDINNDGVLDLLANESPGGTVYISLGNSDGTFTDSGQRISVGQSATTPLGTALGDIDGDGDLDLISNNSEGTVSVRLNDGHGTFSGTQQVPVNGNPLSVTLADIDGDGDLDLLAAATTLSVRINNGRGQFTGTQEISTNGSPFSLALGDLDGNGTLDVVAPSSETNTVSVRLNQATPTPPATAAAIRLNAGGPALTTTRGAFAADQYFDAAASAAFSTTAPVAGTPDPALYQTERFSTHGALRYALPVPNGNYNVVLHFAELYWTKPGQRVFDAALEGQKVLDHYDIVKKVGPLTATTETFAVTVTDGVLNLDLTVPYLTGGMDQAKLSALEVLPVLPTAVRLNAGAGALTTTRGAFAADQYYSANSAAAATTAAITGTPDPALYQTERYSTDGALRYAVPVPNGQYTVVLHFAEFYWTKPGQRVFDAALEGQKVLNHYDIVKKVGPLAATTETFAVTVTDGVLNLDLTVPYLSGGMDQAKLSALEVLSGSAAQVASRGALAIPKNNVSLGLSAYPNPSAGRFTLACTARTAQTATLLLTDELGRAVKQQQVQLQAGPNALAVDATGAPAGLYQLVLRTADGQSQRQKVLIQP
ncbi:FG-GAP-like repeat-containing protein [Hymenobacter coccineus]|uniref:SbsA Ig-like domain-containing protein n=1 Tax=Hymenobacter coccineus TaxID=1908235 RepID=A0A1G1TID1_9BACT|nr:FG-GAP-like repeat-containing protein [Hymenobacter coccineus]OGX90622.1 hypothetical protein BEN49_22145 [Hymenobacter coccineus]